MCMSLSTHRRQQVIETVPLIVNSNTGSTILFGKIGAFTNSLPNCVNIYSTVPQGK